MSGYDMVGLGFSYLLLLFMGLVGVIACVIAAKFSVCIWKGEML